MRRPIQHDAVLVLRFQRCVQLCKQVKKGTVEELATLLEGAGLLFNIFECDKNILILLWWIKVVKLEIF